MNQSYGMLVRELHHLAVLAQHRQFGRAAAALALTQPALSKSIRRLEAAFGAELVERGRNGAALTAAGEIVLHHARLASREMALAGEHIGAAGRGEEGTVTVGASTSLAYRIVPQVAARFVCDYPRVRLRVVTGLNDALFARLRRGRVDLVLSPLPASVRSPELVHERLYADEVHVVARKGHPLARRRRISPLTLLEFPWVLYGRDVLSTEYLSSAFVAAGLQPPELVVESDSAAFNKEFVQNTDFLSYLPGEILRPELEAGKIVALDVPRLLWRRNIGITTHERGSLAPPVQLFAAALRTQALSRPGRAR